MENRDTRRRLELGPRQALRSAAAPRRASPVGATSGTFPAIACSEQGGRSEGLDGGSERDDACRLREHNEELVRLHGERDVLLGTVAHDLRNSVGIVMGYASLLRGEKNVDDVPRLASRILRSAEAISCLVDDLLDVSTTALGAVALRLDAVAMDDLVRDVLDDLDVVARTKCIALELEVQPMPAVRLDCRRFSRVLANLVGNALKYTNTGGRVGVTIRCDDENVKVIVEDTGIGMEPELVARIFAPYQKGQRSGTAGERSIGLGLFIVRCFVEAHGGSITVASEVNVGSTFIVSVPFVPV